MAELRVGPHLVIPDSELRESVSRSSGPGGQHANTTESRVGIAFDIAESNVLSEVQRRALQRVFGNRVVTVSQFSRSQARNRERARRQLAEKIADALVPPRPRRATSATRGSHERRLAKKSRRAELKASRRRPEAGG